MVSLRPLRLAGLALLSTASAALPALTTTGASVTAVPLAATVSFRPGLVTSLTPSISDRIHNVDRAVTLGLGRGSDNKAVPPPVTDGLPLALGSRGIPDIIGIDPAPGTPMSTKPIITVTFGARLPAQDYLVILLSEPGREAALSDPVVHGNAATVTVDPSWPLTSGTYTLRVIATNSAGGDVYYQGTYTVRAGPPAGGTPPGSCGSLHATTYQGWFPKVAGICPAPGSRISTATTFTVTFPAAAALPADTQVEINLFPSDRSGNPTGASAALSDPVVKKNAITVKVAASSPLQPGTYLLEVDTLSPSSGLADYRATYTVS